ncbi:MraY family glycosyltransferase [Paludisphaera soli]|uniref:MraY family glycosyltransferase n=1 Tax=Paludisphaera soli TaxID=2712865 RepID=UPI0013ED8FD6|nr:MraY family glycosyltransferase [Paludisphaera soli]
MMISNGYLMIFAFAMMGCVLATPLVTQFAGWVGAIDKPDGFRRIHTTSVPRLGGLGLALGVAVGVFLPHASAWSANININLPDLGREWPIFLAALIVLVVGFVDDTRSLGPRVKLLGQAAAVMALYLGGIRIDRIDVLGLNLDLGSPAIHFAVLGRPFDVAPPSLLITMFWFLGCMNVWNLIDGMDGLASGVGLLVSGTLTLVALHNQNVEVAILATALAGSLAGFLLYNWHPACIFLGDSGALLIGLLIGVIGVQGSLKGPSAISILFPILAMGLPISDTAMAIFRRWVRNLPMSAADRRHVHHILIGLGLNPRQAALLLYCFSGFLCGAVLLGVSLRSEFLALVLGMSGCLAFLVVVTSRRDELNNLMDDFQARMVRGRQERQAAKLTWEAIQRVELCTSPMAAYEILEKTAEALGCAGIHVACADAAFPPEDAVQTLDSIDDGDSASPGAIFRTVGDGLRITAVMRLAPEGGLAADIVFRYLQRLTQSLGERLRSFADDEAAAREAVETLAVAEAEGGREPRPAPQDAFPIAMAKGLGRRLRFQKPAVAGPSPEAIRGVPPAAGLARR